MHYILLYDLVDDYLERRTPLRPAHLQLASEYQARGELLMAGAFDEPVDGAALVFHTPDHATVERFIEADPYVRQGLVTAWRIRKWTLVIGAPT